MSREDLTRLSINMNPETTDALREYAAAHGVNVTEAVRRAISLLAFMDGAKSNGEHILTVSADRKTQREVVLL